MTAQACKVVLSADCGKIHEAVALLEDVAKRAPEVLKRLLGTVDLSPKLAGIDVDDESAGARELRTRFQPTDTLVQLMPALRALNRDLMVIEHAILSSPASDRSPESYA